MSRICLVDSGSCARASRSLQVHRGYWHYPWYFGTKLPYNYAPIVILHISTGRILGSGSCKTSCTKLKKVKNFTRATPLRSKTPNIVQRDMQIRVALCSSFGPKLIWTATGAPPRPNSEIFRNIPYTYRCEYELVRTHVRHVRTARARPARIPEIARAPAWSMHMIMHDAK